MKKPLPPITLSKPISLTELGKLPTSSKIPLDLHLGPTVASARAPQLVAVCAQVITGWASVEFLMAGIANVIVSGNFASVAELLQVMTSRHQRRRAIVHAARAGGVSEADISLINRCLAEVNRVGNRRVLYAHSIWGHVERYPDYLLMVRQRDMAAGLASEAERVGIRLSTDRAHGWAYIADWSKVLAFSETDLQADAYAVQLAIRMLDDLTHALSDRSDADEVRNALLARLPKRQRKRRRGADGTDKPRGRSLGDAFADPNSPAQ